jgi:glycogen synthase
MEAMAAGVPVVATQIAGVSELVEDGVNGYLVPPGDAVSLAQNIEKLLTNYKLRAAFGTAGRAKVEKDFNIHHEVARLHNLMKSALQGHVEPIRPNYLEGQVFLTESDQQLKLKQNLILTKSKGGLYI